MSVWQSDRQADSTTGTTGADRAPRERTQRAHERRAVGSRSPHPEAAAQMRITLFTTTICSAVAFAAGPPPLALAPPRASVAVRMSEEDASKPPFAVPSLQTLLFILIGGQSVQTLSSEVPRLLAGATPAPYVSIAINLGFVGWAALNLGKGLGLGKKDYYAALDDESVASLARDAGEWALAKVVPTTSRDGAFEVATFAGGCFWGTELHFQRLPGVVCTCVGYTQGQVEKPSYEQVCTGTTGHTEGLQITYDPEKISYEALCDKLLSTVDSTAKNRVGNDRGPQYRHGLYYHTAQQEAAARRALAREQSKQNKPVVTELKPAAVFWPAENYHRAMHPRIEPLAPPWHTLTAAIRVLGFLGDRALFAKGRTVCRERCRGASPLLRLKCTGHAASTYSCQMQTMGSNE